MLGRSIANSLCGTIASAMSGDGGDGGSVSLSQSYRILFIGDSTTVGVGADPTEVTDVNGSRPFSVPLQVRDRFISLGYNAIAETVCGDNGVGISNTLWNGYRSDIAVTGTLANSSRTPTAGGVAIRHQSGTVFTFTSTAPVDTIDFWMPLASGFGTLSLSIDGGTATTYSQANATDDYVKRTVSGLSLETHSFAFSQNPGTAHGPFAINAFNSTVNSFQIFNAGVRNWTTTNWIVSTFPNSPLNSIATLDPHVVVIDLGINDWRQSGTTIATFKTNMQTIIDAIINSGAIPILVLPNAIQSYNTATDTWSFAATLTAYQELAATNSCPLIDTGALYFNQGLSGATNPATWAAMNTAGNMYDTFHPKAAVYAAEGVAVADQILTSLGV